MLITSSESCEIHGDQLIKIAEVRIPIYVTFDVSFMYYINTNVSNCVIYIYIYTHTHRCAPKHMLELIKPRQKQHVRLHSTKC